MPDTAAVSAAPAPPPAIGHPLSVEDVEDIAAYSEKPFEVVSGELNFTSPASHIHGLVTMELAYLLKHHARANKLGTLVAAETGFRLQHPGDPSEKLTVRAPDIAFLGVEKSALPAASSFAEVVPDLVVETLSPGDRASLVSEKTDWWLACGVQEVWVVDPPNRRLTRHLPDGTSRGYKQDGVVEEVPVLPGLRLDLSEVFSES